MLEDSSITLPKKPVTQPGEIVFEITVSKIEEKCINLFLKQIRSLHGLNVKSVAW